MMTSTQHSARRTQRRSVGREVALGILLALIGPATEARAELVMKLLVVNPSETDVKEFDVRSPLPPEVKPEHVLDADGLKVDYDSQAGMYVLIGRVTLKPKESVTKQVVLEDVWIIGAERFSSLRREADDILRKLEGTAYEERGQVLAKAVERRLADVEESQEQPFLNPMQHITRYRENQNTLAMVESDLVSLRQLMVMAALNPSLEHAPVFPAGGQAHADASGLSVLATWRLIFVILGLLGFVSVSFFLLWQRQLKLQLAKQTARDAAESDAPTNGNGAHPADGADILLRLPPTSVPPTTRP